MQLVIILLSQMDIYMNGKKCAILHSYWSGIFVEVKSEFAKLKLRKAVSKLEISYAWISWISVVSTNSILIYANLGK